jgi:DNA-binding response OmpR family regulator
MATALVIETDSSLRQLAEIALTRGGYSVLSASDGCEGIKMARRCHPDFVLVSDRMPKMDGGTVSQLIKRDPDLVQTAVILVCDGDPMHNFAYVQQTGADAVIVKPYRPSELMVLIETLLNDPLPIAS